jgi:hypothetical protein
MISNKHVAVTLSVSMGMCSAAMRGAPAFAQQFSTPHTLASGFYCPRGEEVAVQSISPQINTGSSHNFYLGGGFTRWVTLNHSPFHQFNFSLSDCANANVGLRLDIANKPGPQTITWTWNTSNSINPCFNVALQNKNGLQEFLTFEYIGSNDYSSEGLTHNGNKFQWNTGTLFSGDGLKMQNAWIFDHGDYPSNPLIESISSVTVNGVAVTPNTHNSTLLDCTPYS